MNSKFVEATVLFACSLALALCSLFALQHKDQSSALLFAILSALMGFSAFLVIFADIRSTAKLFENQAVEPK